MKRLKDYYRLYEQLYANPVITICGIAENTGLSRNTVSKYLHHMYANKIIVGPYLTIKPALKLQRIHLSDGLSRPIHHIQWIKGIPARVIPCYGIWRLEHLGHHR